MLDFSDSQAILNKVDRLLNERGWSLYELSAKSGISYSTLYNWHERKTYPSTILLDTICSTFGITLVDFLIDNENLVSPTKEQKELLDLWDTLSEEKRKVVLNVIKNFNK